ncbi:MAG: T9SS type A sorting domain-containing protein [Bacteroidetes bacterium]|nr:T9SS type A sorting domain-containing protein [Bacteroidota bacterium]
MDIFKSTNGGTTWQQISHWYGGFGFQEVHADQHAIVFEPGNSNVIYFGNDGGIQRTANGTAAIPDIISKSDNYNVTQFYACAMNPTAYSSQFIAGAQDNGSQQYNALGINATVEVTGGDGCFTHIDQDQPQFQFTSYVYNNYYRSTNGGASFAGFTSNNTGSFVNPTDYDNLKNNLYASNGNGNYYVILNAPVNNVFTTTAVAAFNSGRVTHISSSPNTSNRVFFGLNNGRVVRVDNAHTGTPVATNLAVAGMPTGTVSCIAIENGNDNHLLATYSNYGSNSVWETVNGGVTWTSVEGNLPDMPVRWALFNPNAANQAILATEIGVWSTDLLNGGATVWGPSNNGLANVRTDMLQIRTSDKLVIAATHGRGLFSTDVFADPFPDFVSDRRIAYTGKPIAFTDVSYKATSWSWNFGDATNSVVKNPTKIYSTPGLYTVTLQINGSALLQNIKVGYIQVLPNRGIPYDPAAGGNFDVNALDFGAETFSGTPFQRGNSAIAGKNGTLSGSNAWVTGVSTATYLDNTDARLWTPNYNFTAPGVYTLKFYRKNVFEIGWDGLRVEYSLDKGDNWTPLGVVAANWYDFANTGGATAFPVNQPYFNQTKSAYTLCQYNVSSLAGNGNVAFRLRFKSDVTVTAAGTSIDDFEIIGPSNSPLPVELADFSGKAFENYNELKWTTLSEINNDHFDLERSVNGVEFIKVGTIQGKGTTSSTSEYVYNDKQIENKNYYYRLKQVDYNGMSKYSGTILLKRFITKEELVSFIFPNPFTDVVNITFNKQIKDPISVELFDLSGKKVYSQKHLSQGVHISVDFSKTTIGSGTYLMKVFVGDEVSIQKVFRK